MSEFLGSPTLNLSTSSSNLSDEEEWQKLETEVPKVSPSVRRFVSTDPSTLFPTVIVIGGGPVGLWTAIQLAIKCPEIQIVIFEKYTEYKRKHIVRVSRKSLQTDLKDERIINLVESIPSVVRTSVLEESLLSLLFKLENVHLVHRFVEDLDLLFSEFPTLQVLIAADGSHSLCRRKIFGVDLDYHEVLQYVVEVKYEVIGQAHKMKLMHQAYPTLKLMNHLANEFVGTARFEGEEFITPVTLRMQITCEEYQSVKDATFKTPLILATDASRVHKELMRDIRIWMNAKKKLFNEQSRDEKLVCVALSVYSAADFATIRKKQDGTLLLCTLVGDAAFGVPFYRSLNNGLLCGTQLSQCISTYLINGPDDRHSSTDKYRSYVRSLSKREMRRARDKRSALTFGKMMIDLNSAVPWQVIFWTLSEAEELEKTSLFGEPVE